MLRCVRRGTRPTPASGVRAADESQFTVTPRRRGAKVRLAMLAGAQFGKARWDQILGAGISEPTLRRWIADGYLHPELPRVYAVGHCAGVIESDLSAALLYAGPGAALSHATAVWWWGLLDHPPELIEISTPRRCRSLDGIRVHRERHVARVIHNGLAVSTASQALLDFAAVAHRNRLRYVLANAEYHDLLDLDELRSLTGRGIAGSAAINKALQRHRPQLAYTRSELERRLLHLCEAHGLPLPTFNVHVLGWLVDAVWPDQRVLVEVDGYRGHRSPAQLERDHQRDLQLRAAGYLVLRYTWRQITRTPAAVVADLGRQLR